MTNIRHFSGSRDNGKRNIASEIRRFELMKKGTLEPQERYKMIMKEKFEESRQKAMAERAARDAKSGAVGSRETRQLSKKAELALKEIAMKKAIKKARELRRRVIINPRQYHNGKLQKDGKIYDIAGNIIGQVDKKTGKITTTTGWSLGKYKAKSLMTDRLIEDSINKYSPYFIQQRKLQMMEQEMAARLAMESGGVWGPRSMPGGGGSGGVWGDMDASTPRFAVNGSAWGAVSDNVHGNFVDNAWGTMVDNVWGGVDTNVWGGMGVGGMWGNKGPKIWGTGNGQNLLKGFTKALATLFGFGFGKQGNKERLAAFNAFRGGGGSSAGGGATARASGRR